MSLNLIHAFSYYLILAFIAGTILRAKNYRTMVGLVFHSAERWPKLRALIKTHRAILLRWPTVLPLALTLLAMLANAYMSHFVWSHAQITPGDLLAHPAGLAAATLAGGLMGLLDFRAVFVFGRLDRPKVEAVLDRAEHWLGSWKAPAVRVLTLGLIHPRRIVGEQVHLALVVASVAMNGQLWAMALQIVVRFGFGLVWFGGSPGRSRWSSFSRSGTSHCFHAVLSFHSFNQFASNCWAARDVQCTSAYRRDRTVSIREDHYNGCPAGG